MLFLSSLIVTMLSFLISFINQTVAMILFYFQNVGLPLAVPEGEMCRPEHKFKSFDLNDSGLTQWEVIKRKGKCEWKMRWVKKIKLQIEGNKDMFSLYYYRCTSVQAWMNKYLYVHPCVTVILNLCCERIACMHLFYWSYSLNKQPKAKQCEHACGCVASGWGSVGVCESMLLLDVYV